MKNVHLLASEDRPAPGDLRFVQGLLNTLDVDSGRDRLSDTRLAAEWLERFGLIPTVAVKAAGYRPPRNDGVRGQLLHAHGETRFLIRSGFHRVAVLSALGHDAVPARLARQRGSAWARGGRSMGNGAMSGHRERFCEGARGRAGRPEDA